jgi:hypothetical protein
MNGQLMAGQAVNGSGAIEASSPLLAKSEAAHQVGVTRIRAQRVQREFVCKSAIAL